MILHDITLYYIILHYIILYYITVCWHELFNEKATNRTHHEIWAARNLNRRGTTLRLLAYKVEPYSFGI